MRYKDGLRNQRIYVKWDPTRESDWMELGEISLDKTLWTQGVEWYKNRFSINHFVICLSKFGIAPRLRLKYCILVMFSQLDKKAMIWWFWRCHGMGMNLINCYVYSTLAICTYLPYWLQDYSVHPCFSVILGHVHNVTLASLLQIHLFCRSVESPSRAKIKVLCH